MEKAPIMGVVQAVSDMMMRRSAGNLPKMRTICDAINTNGVCLVVCLVVFLYV